MLHAQEHDVVRGPPELHPLLRRAHLDQHALPPHILECEPHRRPELEAEGRRPGLYAPQRPTAPLGWGVTSVVRTHGLGVEIVARRAVVQERRGGAASSESSASNASTSSTSRT